MVVHVSNSIRILSVSHKVIQTDQAPAAVGPYSQAIVSDGYIFASGQIGLSPDSGEMQDGLDAQAKQILKNISAVLASANSSFDQVVKTTIFLTDMSDFATVNEIYAKAFSSEPPARSTVQVAGLPLGALVEIEVIARTNS